MIGQHRFRRSPVLYSTLGVIWAMAGGATARAQTVHLLVSSVSSNQVLRYDGQTGAFRVPV